MIISLCQKLWFANGYLLDYPMHRCKICAMLSELEKGFFIFSAAWEGIMIWIL